MQFHSEMKQWGWMEQREAARGNSCRWWNAIIFLRNVRIWTVNCSGQLIKTNELNEQENVRIYEWDLESICASVIRCNYFHFQNWMDQRMGRLKKKKNGHNLWNLLVRMSYRWLTCLACVISQIIVGFSLWPKWNAFGAFGWNVETCSWCISCFLRHSINLIRSYVFENDFTTISISFHSIHGPPTALYRNLGENDADGEQDEWNENTNVQDRNRRAHNAHALLSWTSIPLHLAECIVNVSWISIRFSG